MLARCAGFAVRRPRLTRAASAIQSRASAPDLFAERREVATAMGAVWFRAEDSHLAAGRLLGSLDFAFAPRHALVVRTACIVMHDRAPVSMCRRYIGSMCSASRTPATSAHSTATIPVMEMALFNAR
jgi:hypothetical protein